MEKLLELKIFSGKGSFFDGYFSLPFINEYQDKCYHADIENKRRPNKYWSVLKYFLFVSIVPLQLLNLKYEVSYKIRSAICERFNHKWDVTADISPNTGSEYFECMRCGKSHDIVYY